MSGQVRITAARMRAQGIRWLTDYGRLLAHFAALDEDESDG